MWEGRRKEEGDRSQEPGGGIQKAEGRQPEICGLPPVASPKPQLLGIVRALASAIWGGKVGKQARWGAS